MSNTLAIAAVTATLRNLVQHGLAADPGLAGTTVTTQPPDRARAAVTSTQLNLFLYLTAQDAALRNTPPPSESPVPPLALVLRYLVSAWGQDDDDVLAHRALGAAMAALHDNPVLGAAELGAALAGSDLGSQVERVRITEEPMTVDEMSKLWMTFQSQYRVSAAYQVSVVMIASRLPARAPLPVLSRGPRDAGVLSQPDLTPPFPAIAAVAPPDGRPAVRLGETLTVTGVHLDGDSVVARFSNPKLAAAIDVPAQPGGSSTLVTVALPLQPADWPAGAWTVSLVIARANEPERITAEAAFGLAPEVTSNLPMAVARDAAGTLTVTLQCRPEVRPEQRAALIVGDRIVAAGPHPAQTGTLTFVAAGAAAGDFLIRLRVDGQDSQVVTDYGARPPIFDPRPRLTVT